MPSIKQSHACEVTSIVSDSVTLWAVAHQAPLYRARQSLTFPPAGDGRRGFKTPRGSRDQGGIPHCLRKVTCQKKDQPWENRNSPHSRHGECRIPRVFEQNSWMDSKYFPTEGKRHLLYIPSLVYCDSMAQGRNIYKITYMYFLIKKGFGVKLCFS